MVDCGDNRQDGVPGEIVAFEIYYPDSQTSGESRDCWARAKSDEVQAVVGVYDDCTREVWFGLHLYDPFRWGLKTGSRISDEAFASVMRRLGSR